MKESMAQLLTESLDPAGRELAYQHIESCASCGAEWSGYREAWTTMGDLPEVEVPASVKKGFLERAGIDVQRPANVVPFRRRPVVRWVAQAAAVAILAGGGYFAGRGTAPAIPYSPASITGVSPIVNASSRPYTIAETRVLDAEALSPEIQGRPNISNVQFVDANGADEEIGVSFDVTSRWTVNGNPKDRSMVRLLSYMLENEGAVTQGSSAMEWVGRTYSNPANADPEIASALGRVLRTDSHEGVRIRAIDTLSTLPPSVAAQTRDALIQALKNDPNPAVRIKAVEALATMARSGTPLDPAMIDTLRQKASQNDENLYVRVKAAEALGSMTP